MNIILSESQRKSTSKIVNYEKVINMGNLADYIEAHIKNLFNRATKEVIELQRRELAEQFGCVPSQITYVLSTVLH